MKFHKIIQLQKRPGIIHDVHYVPKLISRAASASTSSTASSTSDSQQQSESSLESLAELLGVSSPSTKKSYYTTSSSSSSSSPEDSPFPTVIGHRGSLHQALENTLESFQLCADAGAQGIELDLFCLKDCQETVVVFHGKGPEEFPGRLDEYCGVPGSILDLTLEQVRNLTFNQECPEFVCPPETIRRGSIPTLEEVLQLAQRTNLQLKLELKGGPNLVPATLALVEQYDMVQQCTFTSFNHARIQEVRRLRPQKTQTTDFPPRHVYRTGALFRAPLPADFIERSRRVGADEIQLRYDICSRSVVQQIHRAGFQSMAWCRGPGAMRTDVLERFNDVYDEDEVLYDILLRTGVQTLCVNKPDLLIKRIQQLQQEREQKRQEEEM